MDFQTVLIIATIAALIFAVVASVADGLFSSQDKDIRKFETKYRK